MRTPVLLPELGLAAGQPIALSVWFAEPGDRVYEGDRLVEVIVTGATFDVSSPATGRLAEIVRFPDEPIHPGEVLGWINAPE